VAPPGNQAETEKTNINLQQREKSDYSTKVKNTPSPLMGEWWGDGELLILTISYVPPPLNPLPRWEGNLTFYETIKY